MTTKCVGRGMASPQKVGSHFPHPAGCSLFPSSESNWRLIIPTSTVAVLLLLVLMVLMILYFKKARGSAGKGKAQSWLRADH